jgi:adenylate cyclase
MFQILWNLLTYQGNQYVITVTEHKHIVLVNTLSMFIPAFLTVNTLMIFSLGATPIFLEGSMLYIVMVPFTILLNSNGKILSARLYLLLISIIFIITNCLVQGNQTNGHFFFLAEALVVYFTFPTYQKKIMYSIVFILLTLFIGFAFFHDNLIPIRVINPNQVKSSSFITDVSFAMMFLGFAFYIHNTFQKTEISFQLEFDKSENLLKNILPLSIIQKLRENPDTIAERFDDCTILFSDIVGFTQMSKNMSAADVVFLLNEVFSRFDDLAEKYNLEKIKTIGDAYMIVGGLPVPDDKHAERVATFALEMLEVIREYREKNNIELELRIGINSGSAVAGVIGKKKFIYDLWGDSVNTASRMESHGLPGQIQVSESTYSQIKDLFQFEDRGKMELKGLGMVQSYLLTAKQVS